MLSRLQAAFESQRRFIANASHELRTPLTVMRATVDVVLAKPAPTEAELLGMGRDVRVAVDLAEAVIGALLTLARNERGLTVHENVDLATVAEDVLDGVEPGDRQLHASLQPVVTSGDPVLLERLVANLVDNATRYNVPAVTSGSPPPQPPAGPRSRWRTPARPSLRTGSTACSSRSSVCTIAPIATGSGSGWPSSPQSPPRTTARSPPTPCRAEA